MERQEKSGLIKEHDYRYLSHPPYEMICHRDLPAGDVLYLKAFAEVFDLFYNSKRFRFSLDFQFRRRRVVEVFDALREALDRAGGKSDALSLEAQYELFARTLKVAEHPEARDRLKLDYLYHQRVYRLPGFMRRAPWPAEEAEVRTWPGDRRSPVVPFRHVLRLTAGRLELTPAPAPVEYAVVHPPKTQGYLPAPRLCRIGEE